MSSHKTTILFYSSIHSILLLSNKWVLSTVCQESKLLRLLHGMSYLEKSLYILRFKDYKIIKFIFLTHLKVIKYIIWARNTTIIIY